MADVKKQRINKILNLYYSRPEIQKTIFDFSQNREIVPKYFEGFGKRPDSFQYIDDVFGLVRKGATSFNCSEELWENPLEISTELSRKQLNEMRIGWDLLLDIDSKYLDYSKILARLIINVLKFHGVKNFKIKFSGSKGFHIVVPWKAFPKEINEVKTSDMFPEYPRIITKYLTAKTKSRLIEEISNLSKPNKYVKDYKAPEEVVPDLVAISPRHLFRMPYSLHEKTALASIVLDEDELDDFQPMNANPLKAEVKNFLPDAKENEAKELLMQALDWYKEKHVEEDTGGFSEKKFEYKPVKISNLQSAEKNFPPTIKRILQGVQDGRKRALFILINFFRALGMDKDELEQRIYSWNEKNEIPLKTGYIKSQLSWSFRNKIVPPPNFDKDYYKGIGVPPTKEELRYKNPVNYTAKKFFQNKKSKKGDFKNKKSKKKNKSKSSEQG